MADHASHLAGRAIGPQVGHDVNFGSDALRQPQLVQFLQKTGFRPFFGKAGAGHQFEANFQSIALDLLHLPFANVTQRIRGMMKEHA